MTRSTRFWDRIAARYARKPVADEAAYQKKLAVTREYLRPDMEVLELGCGTGFTYLGASSHSTRSECAGRERSSAELHRRSVGTDEVETDVHAR